MKKAILYERTGDDIVKCALCAHNCEIKPDAAGVCLTRINRDGVLYTQTYGAAAGLAVDPVEKKPFFHFKPGSSVLSFGTDGCNFNCRNCQNWHMSQALRTRRGIARTKGFSPEEILDAAAKRQVEGIAYTYSEPTIFFEYARDVILAAKKRPESADMSHMFVSNGYFSDELIDLIFEENLLDAVNIDLKFMSDEKYRKIAGARLQPVLNSIERIGREGSIHIEIINLIIPGENDSPDDIRKTADFIASVSPDIPLHVNRFYPQYKMDDREPTPVETLLRAKEIAEAAGLRYVYIGNAQAPGSQNTYCPNCKTLLVERSGYGIRFRYFDPANPKSCPKCGESLYFST